MAAVSCCWGCGCDMPPAEPESGSGQRASESATLRSEQGVREMTAKRWCAATARRAAVETLIEGGGGASWRGESGREREDERRRRGGA